MLDNAEYLLKRFFTQHGAEILISAVFFVFAVLFAYLAGRALTFLLRDRFKVDNRIVKLIVRTFRISIITLAVITLLSEFGIEIASLLTGLGVVGFGLAIGMRTSINNFITGMMLNALAPYEEGDYIEGGGVKGVVESVTLFHTVVATTEGVFVSVPNGPMWAKSIKNNSRKKPRMLDFSLSAVGVSEPSKLVTALEETLKKEQLAVKGYPVVVIIEGLLENGLKIRGGLWCNPVDALAIAGRLPDQLKATVEATGSKPEKVIVYLGAKPAPKKEEEPADAGDEFT